MGLVDYLNPKLLRSIIFPSILPRLPSDHQPDTQASDPAINGLIFRDGWDARPRYHSDGETEGVFVGRETILERLTSDFIGKRSGTILISGVRGVGKTALVERALLDARNKLQDYYWKNATPLLENSRFWHPVSSRVREVLVTETRRAGAESNHQAIKEAAAVQYSRRPVRWFWQRLNPVTQVMRRMHEASRSQLLVLKFNASDIGGAMALPSDNETSERPNINPEKLLRALIRKLFMTCHSSRSTVEADLLRWSLRPKKSRTLFFDTLQNAYDKSISKSYTETRSNNIKEALQRSQTTLSERKITLDRVIGLAICLTIGGVASLLGWRQGWYPLQWLTLGGGATLIAGYFTWRVNSKTSRQKTFDRAQESRFSYEYDYSLARMEYDLEEILGTLREPKKGSFDSYRCHSRKIVIFDELDKLEDPIQQLSSVITHFKNFFTLSNALFVFLTDHQFYEHLEIEKKNAQLRRHYSPEHTFFTQKLYLRKPDFDQFNETVFGFCNAESLEQRVEATSLDPDLIDYLVKIEPDFFKTLTSRTKLETLTHLYINRRKFPSSDSDLIEQAFEQSGGWSDSLSVAQIWAAAVAGPKMSDVLQKKLEQAFATARGRENALAIAHVWAATGDSGQWKKDFKAAGGWDNPQAVSFLFQRQSRFSRDDKNSIQQRYTRFKQTDIKDYSSVDNITFTLSDLARTLCFETRNHYFDLYQNVYDYVGSYSDGLPVLNMEDERFLREQRLASRYQQMVHFAFYYRRENHPSREYFNFLLMETLYSVFDTRGWGGVVKIADILFSPQKILESLQQPSKRRKPTAAGTGKASSKAAKGAARTSTLPASPPEDASSNGRSISTVTVRDGEKINEALLRLLRIAVARKAIRVRPDVAERLKQGALRLEDVPEFTFEWEPDCEPEVTQEGLDLEKYESDLIQFWTENQSEIDGFDLELERAWSYAEVPVDSAVRKTRAVFSELRITAEGLLRRSRNVSSQDAARLRGEIGAPASWGKLALDLILERIRAIDVDVQVFDMSSARKTTSADLSLPEGMESFREEIQNLEKVVGLPLRAIIRPIPGTCLIYLAGGPTSADIDPKLIEQSLTKPDSYVFWYGANLDTEVIPTPPVLAENWRVRFYNLPPAEPSISSLLTHFGLLTFPSKLRHLATAAKSQNYRGSVGLLAGLELITPLSGLFDLIILLTQPGLPAAMKALDELPTSFKANPEAFWGSYGIILTKSSADEAAKSIANQVASSLKQNSSESLRTAIERTIRQGLNSDPAKIESSTILSAADHANGRSLLQELIASFVRRQLEVAKIDDPKFEEFLRKDFIGWLLGVLEKMAKDRQMELAAISAFLPTMAQDLAKYRLAAKSGQAGS